MTNPTTLLVLLGRTLLAFVFIMAGLGKLGDVSGTMAYTASAGIPGILAIPAIALEIGGGLALLAGWQTRWAALGLAAFSLVAGVLYHYVPAQAAEGMEAVLLMTMFHKNLAISGGLLALAGFGAGSLSVDARASQGRLATA